MIMKCVIIDDEPLAVNVIKNYISQIKEIVVSETFNSGLESLEYLQKNKIDILFLDINMPLLDGYDLLKSLKHRPEVIITTAHPEYAVKGFELNVSDYLVKPIPFPRFLQAVKKVIEKNLELTKNQKDHIFVKVNKKQLIKIYFEDIVVIESLKDYIKIFTEKETFLTHQTLTGFTENLPADKFIRIHRSYTIAVDKVSSIEGNFIKLNGKKYTIGRNYLEEAKRQILN